MNNTHKSPKSPAAFKRRPVSLTNVSPTAAPSKGKRATGHPVATPELALARELGRFIGQFIAKRSRASQTGTMRSDARRTQ